MEASRCHHPYHQNRSAIPSPRKSRIITSPSKNSKVPSQSTTPFPSTSTGTTQFPTANHHYHPSNSRLIPELRPFGTAVARQMYVITRLMQEGYLSFREHSILRSLSLASNPDLRYILPPSLVQAGDDDYLTEQYYSTMISTHNDGYNRSNSSGTGSITNSTINTGINHIERSLSPPGSPSARHERAKQLTYLHQHHLPFDNVFPNNHRNIDHFHTNHSSSSSSSEQSTNHQTTSNTSSSSSSSSPHKSKKSLADRSIATWDPLITLLMERRRDITDLVPYFNSASLVSATVEASAITSSTLSLYNEYYNRLVAKKLPYPLSNEHTYGNNEKNPIGNGPVSPAQALSDLVLALRHLVEQEAERQFHSIFSYIMDADIKLVSRKERDARGLLPDSSLTYGEIRFTTFATVVRLAVQDLHQGLPDTSESTARLEKGLTFVDLGSGAGKAIIAVALLFNMKRIIGIEVLEGLHLISEEAVRRYFQYYSQQYQTDQSSIDRTGITIQQLGNHSTHGMHSMKTLELPTIDLYRASFLPQDLATTHGNKFPPCPVDWANEGDIIFANSTCFSDTLMNSIANQVPYMRNGTILISFTRSFEHEHIHILRVQKYTQSWGNATVFIARVQHPEGYVLPSRPVKNVDSSSTGNISSVVVGSSNDASSPASKESSSPPLVYYVPVPPPPKETANVDTDAMTPLTPWNGPPVTFSSSDRDKAGSSSVEVPDGPLTEKEPNIPLDSRIGETNNPTTSTTTESAIDALFSSSSAESPRQYNPTPLHDLLDDDVEYEKQLVHELEDYIDKTTKAYVADMEEKDKYVTNEENYSTVPNDNESTLEYDDTGYSGPVMDAGALLLHIEEQKKLNTPLQSPQKSIPHEKETIHNIGSPPIHPPDEDTSSTVSSSIVSSSRIIPFGSDRWYMVHAARRGELISPEENLWAATVVTVPVHSTVSSSPSSKPINASPSRPIITVTDNLPISTGTTTVNPIHSPTIVRASPHTDLSSPQGEMLLSRKYQPRKNIFSPTATIESPLPTSIPVLPLTRSKSDETTGTSVSTTSEAFRPIENNSTANSLTANNHLSSTVIKNNPEVPTTNGFFRSGSRESNLSAITDSPTEEDNEEDNEEDSDSPLPEGSNDNNPYPRLSTVTNNGGSKPLPLNSIGKHMIVPSTLDTTRIATQNHHKNTNNENTNRNGNNSTGSTPIVSPRSNTSNRNFSNNSSTAAAVSRVRATSADSYSGGGIGEASADLAKILAGYAASQAAQAAALVAALSNHTNNPVVMEETEGTADETPFLARPQSSPTEESIPEELPYVPNSDDDDINDADKHPNENDDNNNNSDTTTNNDDDDDDSTDDMYPPPIEWTVETVNNTVDSIPNGTLRSRMDNNESNNYNNDDYTVVNVSTTLEDALHSSHIDLSRSTQSVKIPHKNNVSTLRFNTTKRNDNTQTMKEINVSTDNDEDANDNIQIMNDNDDGDGEEIIGYITRNRNGKTVFHSGSSSNNQYQRIQPKENATDQQQENQLLQAVIGNGPVISPSHLTHRSLSSSSQSHPSLLSGTSRINQATKNVQLSSASSTNIRSTDTDSPFGEALLSRKALQTKLDDNDDSNTGDMTTSIPLPNRPTQSTMGGTITNISDAMTNRDLRRAVLSARMRTAKVQPSIVPPPSVPVNNLKNNVPVESLVPALSTTTSNTSVSASTVSSTNTSLNEVTKQLQFSSAPSSTNSSFTVASNESSLHIRQPVKYNIVKEVLGTLLNETDRDDSSPMDDALYKRKVVSDMNTSIASRSSTQSSKGSTVGSSTLLSSSNPHPYSQRHQQQPALTTSYTDSEEISSIKRASNAITEQANQEFLLGAEVRDSPQGTALVQRKIKSQPLK